MRENTPPHTSANIDLEEEDLIEADEIELNEENPEFSGDDVEEIELEAEDDDRGEHFARVPERDDSVLTFDKHQQPVFCCATHPRENVAATGGMDDIAYVWSLDDGEVIHKVEHHKDTVVAVGFSHDGKFFATGDMAGEIFVFSTVKNYQKVWEYSMGDMCWMKWHSGAHILMAGADSGEIYIWRVPSSDCKILPGAGEKCETGELTKDGKHIFAGYGDGTFKLWDIKYCTTVFKCDQSHPISHKDCVNTVSCNSENSVFLSGSEDGTVVISTHNGPLGSINLSDSVEEVAICPDSELNTAGAATVSGQIVILDLSKQSVRTTCEHIENEEAKDGITSMIWIPKEALVCGTMHGHILLYNGRNGEKIRHLDGHAATIYEISYKKDQNILLTASEDGTSKVFKCID